MMFSENKKILGPAKIAGSRTSSPVSDIKKPQLLRRKVEGFCARLKIFSKDRNAFRWLNYTRNFFRCQVFFKISRQKTFCAL